MTTLHGDGVTLRPWRPQDAEALLAGGGDRAISDWSTFPHDATPEALVGWIARQGRGPHVSLAVTRSADDVALGYCGLNGPDRGPEHVSLGYWLLAAARGDGLALRAARPLTAWAFATGLATRITLMIEPSNTASRRVADGLGATAQPHEEVMASRRGVQHRFLRYELYAS